MTAHMSMHTLTHTSTHARTHTHTHTHAHTQYDISCYWYTNYRLNILSRKELMTNARRCLIIYHQIIVMKQLTKTVREQPRINEVRRGVVAVDD